ncbi:MAG: hypothetical protein ACREEB_12620 [Caulobacteraceae bacterium]
MTKLLDRAVDTIRALPAETQDDLARLLLRIAGENQPSVPLTPSEAASFRDSLAESSRGERATEDEVRSVWAKHGL